MINDVKIGIKLIKSELVRSKVINRLYVNLLIFSCLLQKTKEKNYKIFASGREGNTGSILSFHEKGNILSGSCLLLSTIILKYIIKNQQTIAEQGFISFYTFS